jgi:hypothetical protein
MIFETNLWEHFPWRNEDKLGISEDKKKKVEGNGITK